MRKKIMVSLLVVIDAILMNLAFLLAFYIRFDGNIMGDMAVGYFSVYIENAFILTMIKLVLLYIFGLYKNLWKYASIEEVLQIVGAAFVANTGVVTYMMMTQQKLPRSIYILIFLLDTVLIGGIRLSYRATRGIRKYGFYRKGKQKRIMVIGAGQAGAMVIKELRRHDDLKSKAVAIIDDDESKLGARIHGVPVLGD